MIDFAYAADAATSTGSSIIQWAPIALIMILFWFLVIRPQQQKVKAHQKMVGELKRGDKIITAAGILGTITKVKDHLFVVEIAEGVEIQIEKNAIANTYDPNAKIEEKK